MYFATMRCPNRRVRERRFLQWQVTEDPVDNVADDAGEKCVRSALEI